jgi:hypothetical protein
MDKKNEIEQLDMGLKEPISNRFKNFKYKVEIFFIGLRTNSLFTAPFLWISCALVASFILIQNYYYVNFIDKLPKEVPLFLIAKSPELRLVDKDFLLWILIISVALTIISLLIAVKTYYKFKFISVFTMTNLVLGLLLLTISYIKIFSIYIF